MSSRISHSVVLVACSVDSSGAGRTCVSRINSAGSKQTVFVDDYSVGYRWSDPVSTYLKDSPGSGGPRVVFDLGQVELIKSRWVGGLVRLYLEVRQAGGVIAYARPHNRMVAVFEVTEVCRVFELFETVEGALDRCLES